MHKEPSGQESIAGAKRALRPLMTVVALFFVAYAAVEARARWDQAPKVVIEPLGLLSSAIPLLAAMAIQGQAWIYIVERLGGRRVDRRRAMVLYLDSQLARFTPGKVGLPVVRMAGARSLGTTARLTGTSIALEMLSWTAVGGVVGCGICWATDGLRAYDPLAGSAAPIAFAVSLAALALLVFVPLGRYPKATRRLLNAPPELSLVPLRAPAVQALFWLAWAAHGACLAGALGADPSAALQASGLFPLATVTGFVVLAAPGGLGMREAVLVLGLTPILGAGGAVTASVLSRALSLAAEVLACLSARVVERAWRAR